MKLKEPLYVAESANHRVRKIILIPQAPVTPSAMAGSDQATVSWSAAPLAADDDVQSYQVRASTGQTCAATAPATSCLVTGLLTASPITFSVVAINRAGFESPAATVTHGPVVSTASALPNATEGQAYTPLTLAATGGNGTSYTWAVAGSSLPTGLLLSPAGVISGTPSVNGTFSFEVTVTDADGVTSQAQTFNLTVDPVAVVVVPPTITTTGALPDAIEGQWYSHALDATGGVSPYTWSLASGSLPPGLTLDSSGVISGTVPKVAMQSGASASGQASKAVGTFNFSVATGGGTPALASAPQALSLRVVAAAPATVTSVPTLGAWAWALALLGVLTAGLGLRRKREHSKALG